MYIGYDLYEKLSACYQSTSIKYNLKTHAEWQGENFMHWKKVGITSSCAKNGTQMKN